jgi:hypothetical protein
LAKPALATVDTDLPATTATKADLNAVNVDLTIRRWRIKKQVTTAFDLNRMAETVGIDPVRERDSIHKRKYGSYWAATLWDGSGESTSLDVKVGTAVLAKPAKTNMVIDLTYWKFAVEQAEADRQAEEDKWNGWSSANRYSGQAAGWYNNPKPPATRTILVLFKGKRIADVYSQFSIQVIKPGKLVGAYRLAKPIKFARNKRYPATTEPWLTVSPVANLPATSPTIPIYYGNQSRKATLKVTAPYLFQGVKVLVKNQAQSLNSPANKKSPIYKAALKKVGTYSSSCDATAGAIWGDSGVTGMSGDRSYLKLSLAAGRSGAQIDEPGHISVLIGPGATGVHGDVFSHKTFLQNSPLRNTYYVMQPFWNLFH